MTQPSEHWIPELQVKMVLPKWVVARTWLGCMDYPADFNIQYRPDWSYVRRPHKEGVRLFLHYGDLTDGTTLRRILEEVTTEIYNLGLNRMCRRLLEYTVDSVGMLVGGNSGPAARDWSAVLPGWFFGDVWFGTASPTNRNNAVLSTQSICLCQGLCPLETTTEKLIIYFVMEYCLTTKVP